MARRAASAARIAGILLGSVLPGARGLYDAEHLIESARVYGNIQAFGYYFIDLVVGTPRQRVSVIIDTGSSIAAFPCASCTHCGHHVDPAFDISQSTTAQWVMCGDMCHDQCKQGHCSYLQGYSEGSSVGGLWFEDEVQLGDSIQHNPAIRSRMGCHYLETNLFYNQKANGIMGIGPQQKTLFHALFTDRRHISSEIFALCLAEWGGRLVVGGHNESYHTGPMQYMPLNTGSGTYGVPLTALSVDGRVVSTALGSAMVDSGTTYTYMASLPYHALRNAIEERCKAGHCGQAKQLYTGVCWHLPQGAADLERFPRVEMSFQGVVVRWVPSGYMFRKDGANTWCYSFQDDGPLADTTLGASWMMHNEVVFDMQNGRLGVAPARCPEYRRRPKHSASAAEAWDGGGEDAATEERGAESKEEDTWGVQVSVEGLGTMRTLRWWELLPLGLLTLLPVGCLGRRCIGWRPCSSSSHSRLVREPEIGGVVLGTSEDSAEVEAAESCAPWL